MLLMSCSHVKARKDAYYETWHFGQQSNFEQTRKKYHQNVIAAIRISAFCYEKLVFLNVKSLEDQCQEMARGMLGRHVSGADRGQAEGGGSGRMWASDPFCAISGSL